MAIENEIISKVNQMKETEQSIKNLSDPYGDGSQLELEDLPTGLTLSTFSEKLNLNNKNIKERVYQLGQKVENLSNEPMDSIKKAKREYEINNDAMIKTLRSTLLEKRGNLFSLNEEKENKVKTLDEKKSTSLQNEKRIEKLQTEFNNSLS